MLTAKLRTLLVLCTLGICAATATAMGEAINGADLMPRNETTTVPRRLAAPAGNAKVQPNPGATGGTTAKKDTTAKAGTSTGKEYAEEVDGTYKSDPCGKKRLLAEQVGEVNEGKPSAAAAKQAGKDLCNMKPKITAGSSTRKIAMSGGAKAPTSGSAKAPTSGSAKAPTGGSAKAPTGGSAKAPTGNTAGK